jgi:hypothetical protein
VRVKREIEIRRKDKGGRGAINRIEMHDAHRRCTLPFTAVCDNREGRKYSGEKISARVRK